LTDMSEDLDQHGTVTSPVKKSVKDALLSTKYSIDNTAYNRYLSDRRRSFRFRGSQGTTVASAPSCEHEDYRSPRPLIPPIKPGKSFDAAAVDNRDRFSNGMRSNGSTNAILQVTCHLELLPNNPKSTLLLKLRIFLFARRT
jgi:hypothetical protein